MTLNSLRFSGFFRPPVGQTLTEQRTWLDEHKAKLTEPAHGKSAPQEPLLVQATHYYDGPHEDTLVLTGQEAHFFGRVSALEAAGRVREKQEKGSETSYDAIRAREKFTLWRMNLMAGWMHKLDGKPDSEMPPTVYRTQLIPSQQA